MVSTPRRRDDDGSRHALDGAVPVLPHCAKDASIGHSFRASPVVDAETFTDAAIALGTSQAAVSRSVAALERVLGVRLLLRTTRSVAATPAGDGASGPVADFIRLAGGAYRPEEPDV